jgi:hypothetical protein
MKVSHDRKGLDVQYFCRFPQLELLDFLKKKHLPMRVGKSLDRLAQQSSGR